MILECPDTFIDKVLGIFGCGKKKELARNDPSQESEEMPQVVGECKAIIVAGQEWDNGKDGVETDNVCPLLGEAKIFCMYGGEIKLENAGQPEAGSGSSNSLQSNEQFKEESMSNSSAEEFAQMMQGSYGFDNEQAGLIAKAYDCFKNNTKNENMSKKEEIHTFFQI